MTLRRTLNQKKNERFTPINISLKKKQNKCLFAVHVIQFYFSLSSTSRKNFDSISLFLRQPCIQRYAGIWQFSLHFSGVVHKSWTYVHSVRRVLHALRQVRFWPWTYTDTIMRTRKADINRFICKKKKEKSCEIIATAHTMTLSNRKADIVKAKSESVFQIQRRPVSIILCEVWYLPLL